MYSMMWHPIRIIIYPTSIPTNTNTEGTLVITFLVKHASLMKTTGRNYLDYFCHGLLRCTQRTASDPFPKTHILFLHPCCQFHMYLLGLQNLPFQWQQTPIGRQKGKIANLVIIIIILHEKISNVNLHLIVFINLCRFNGFKDDVFGVQIGDIEPPIQRSYNPRRDRTANSKDDSLQRIKRSNFAEDQFDMLEFAGDLLSNTLAINGRACTQRLICEISEVPVDQLSFIGKLLHEMIV